MSGRRRGNIFVKVLAVVVGAGLVPLLLATAATGHLLTRDKEAALVDGAVATAEARRDALEHHVALARAELRTVALAGARGQLLVVPDIVTPPIVAVRCMADGDELVDAAVDASTAERLRAASVEARGLATIGDGLAVVHERAGDVDAWAMLDLRAVLEVPDGWTLRLATAGAESAAGEPVVAGAVVARRETRRGAPVVTAVAPSATGLDVIVRAPITPARWAAFEITRDAALWSLLAVIPLVLLAVFLARAVTSPIRALSRAVRDTREGPVALPPLPADEIGDLGVAITTMSDQLRADATILRGAVRFARRVARLRDEAAILGELERALSEAFGDLEWRALSAEEAADGDRAALASGASLAALLERACSHEDPDTAAVPVPMTQLDEDSVVVALAARGRVYGAVIGRGPQEHTSVPMVELLCRTAVGALENLALQQSALVNEKLAALGRLSASVAHEMNNPLAFVTANLRALEDALPGELKATAADAREGAERLGRIVDDLSSMSRGGSKRHRDVQDLAQVAHMAVKIARARRAGAILRVEAPEPAYALCDRGRVEQALLNLVINAVDACAGREQADVTVRVGSRAGVVHLDVSDNGAGIPPGARRRIFDAFFTTKGDAGTGLGLFLSRSFVQADGGDLTLVATGTSGTTFRITLPSRAAAPQPESSPAVATEAGAARPARSPGGKPRILLLDDEPAIVRAMTRWLSRRAEVVGTSDPREALRLASERPFDLVLCDLHMPAMDGAVFVDALCAQSPELSERIVIMTGSSAGGLSVPVLRKPVSLGDIEELLAHAC